MPHFYRVHGRVLEGVFVFAPELSAGGGRDAAGARLLLKLLAARGPAWLATEWTRGGLAPLFRSGLLAELHEARGALGPARGELATAQGELAATQQERAAAQAELAALRRELAADHGSL
ncbi:MAG TPA: hypothetical protein VHR45_08565 [Thermoanaerobaculia bacterium]|nr:hypothetical protein [Thermoanaerobaculia bacterium]